MTKEEKIAEVMGLVEALGIESSKVSGAITIDELKYSIDCEILAESALINKLRELIKDDE